MIDIRKEELFELGKAWLALTVAFSILFRNMGIGIVNTAILSFLTVGLAFVVHELAHKIIAQYYKCIAEFKANNTMLIAAILMAFLGFVLASPGAVYIKGFVTRAQNGIISLAGPVSNLVMALLFIPIMYLPGLYGVIGYFGVFINSFIGLFNMIPFMPFDGAKVWIWNKTYYVVTVIMLLSLTIWVLFI